MLTKNTLHSEEQPLNHPSDCQRLFSTYADNTTYHWRERMGTATECLICSPYPASHAGAIATTTTTTATTAAAGIYPCVPITAHSTHQAGGAGGKL
eukprot:1160719-Pelagomonas_calceolata.AAC.3